MISLELNDNSLKKEDFDKELEVFLKKIREYEIEKKEAIILNKGKYEHNSDSKKILNFYMPSSDDKIHIQTSNLVGFLGKDENSLFINSRFGEGFLLYLISNSSGYLPLEDLGGFSEYHNSKKMIVFMAIYWKIRLIVALRLGFPKIYRKKIEKLSYVRGSLDTLDYSLNYPSPKYICHYKEHSHENPALYLFIKTYEFLREDPSVRNILTPLKGVYSDMKVITQGKKKSYQELLQTPFFTNPFYYDYNQLITISKMILLGESSLKGKKETSFIFDISMLYEYFIKSLIEKVGFSTFKRKPELKIPTGGDSKKYYILEPDFIWKNLKDEYCLFDAKYKNFDKVYGAKREDLFQLHTYLGTLSQKEKVHCCGFIYPREKREDKEKLRIRSIARKGEDIPFYILFLDIPSYSSDKDFNYFQKEMDESIGDLKIIIQEISDKSLEEIERKYRSEKE